jgi:hypothetical protein
MKIDTLDSLETNVMPSIATSDDYNAFQRQIKRVLKDADPLETHGAEGSYDGIATEILNDIRSGRISKYNLTSEIERILKSKSSEVDYSSISEVASALSSLFDE